MRAKDYYKKYYEIEPCLSISMMILSKMNEERIELIKKRGNSQDTLISIIQETNDKWEAFVKLVNDEQKAKKEAYKIFININYPKLYERWMEKRHPLPLFSYNGKVFN